MKMKGLIAAALAAIMLAGTAVYAADANDIADMFKKNAPSGEELNTLLSLKTADGIEAKDFTGAALIHRLYRIKNDGDHVHPMFSDYSGSLENELDTEMVTWHIPVVENGNIVSEYLYDEGRESLLDTEHTDVKDNIGLATMYDYDRLAGIINAADIGEPTDIKSVYIVSPGTAFFMYVKTASDEYIIPMLPVRLGYYDESGKYAYKTVFDALQVYPADELVEAYKTAWNDRERYGAELEKSDNNEPYTYLDGSGEIAQTTPKPKATQKPTDNPEPTAAPKQTDKPKVTAEPTATVKPTAAPSATTEPQPTADNDGWQDTITVHNTPDKGLFMSINDTRADLGGAEIFIDENDRTQMPVRAVSELLNAKVDWNEATRAVTVTRGDNILTLEIGSKIMYKNGDPVEMDTAAVIVNDLTYIPLRYIGEALDCMVAYTTSEIPFEGRRKILTGDDVYEDFFEKMSAEEVKEILDAARIGD